MKKAFIAGIIMVFVLAVVVVIAEDKIPLEVRIKSIKGDVEVKLQGDPWQTAASGMVLKEGAQLSTGFDAEAELILADNSIVKVSQLTQMKIDEFFREKAKVKTGIDLKIGKISAKVQRVGEELSDFNVVTPTSVVSVRGTKTDVRETDKGTDVQTWEHMVDVRDKQFSRPVLVRPGQETTVEPGRAPTPVEIESQMRAKADTAVYGMTREEKIERREQDRPEVRPGEPGKLGSVS